MTFVLLSDSLVNLAQPQTLRCDHVQATDASEPGSSVGVAEAGGDCNPLQSFSSISYVLDALFWLDLLLCFRTGYVDDRNMVHMQPRGVAMNYLRTWFPVDLLANLPFEYIIGGMVLGRQPRGFPASLCTSASRLSTATMHNHRNCAVCCEEVSRFAKPAVDNGWLTLQKVYAQQKSQCQHWSHAAS
jgi:hypothetical protein